MALVHSQTPTAAPDAQMKADIRVYDLEERIRQDAEREAALADKNGGANHINPISDDEYNAKVEELTLSGAHPNYAALEERVLAKMAGDVDAVLTKNPHPFGMRYGASSPARKQVPREESTTKRVVRRFAGSNMNVHQEIYLGIVSLVGALNSLNATTQLEALFQKLASELGYEIDG